MPQDSSSNQAGPDTTESVNRLASRFNVPSRVLRDAIKDGELPAYWLGRWLRVRRCDAEAWLESKRFTPTPGAPLARADDVVVRQLARARPKRRKKRPSGEAEGEA